MHKIPTEEEYYKEFWELHERFNPGGVSDPIPYEEYLYDQLGSLPKEELIEVLERAIKQLKDDS